jgi:uncharacterized protein (DUF1501 family)
MSKIHLEKRRDFLKGAACLVASGGASSFVPQLSLMGAALAGTPTGYRALVCLYLDGGNDSWNMVIPTSVDRHNEYTTARGGLFQADLNASRLGIPRPGQGTATTLPSAIALNSGGPANPNSFGVNPFAPELANLYNSGRLAFIANVGPLVAPIRRQGFSSTPRPPQLYSHNDQTSLWQIGGGSNSSDPFGWGGRLAGKLLGAQPQSGLSPCISIAGQTRFLVGEFTNEVGASNGAVFPYRVNGFQNTGNPASSLANYPANDGRTLALQALMDLNSVTYPSAFSQEYQTIVDRSLDLATGINRASDDIRTDTAFNLFNAVVWPNTGIANQLRQVARMVAVSHPAYAAYAPTNPALVPINANRQIYFVRTGGYDTHDGQITSLTIAQGHHARLQEISQAVNAFNNAITALNNIPGYSGVNNGVTLFSMSDFARTINSNGNGTDHAWGGVHFVMGGAVSGGQIVGPYPRQILNLTQNDAAPLPAHEVGECFNRGEFLPRVAVDQLAATLSKWMGLNDSEVDMVYPNIGNFANAAANAPIAFRSRYLPNLMAGV